MQLLHDVAQIGKKVRDGTAKLGLTLSCNSTLLANDKSRVKLIVSHGGRGGAHLPRDSCQTSRDRNHSEKKKMCIQSMETQVVRKAKSKVSLSFVQDVACAVAWVGMRRMHQACLLCVCTRAIWIECFFVRSFCMDGVLMSPWFGGHHVSQSVGERHRFPTEKLDTRTSRAVPSRSLSGQHRDVDRTSVLQQ